MLAPNVRWGGEEDTPEACRSSIEVLARYRRMYDQGVRGCVQDTMVRGNAIIVQLGVVWPGEAGQRSKPGRTWQIFHTHNGLIDDIRGYPRMHDALAYAESLGTDSTDVA